MGKYMVDYVHLLPLFLHYLLSWLGPNPRWFSQLDGKTNRVTKWSNVMVLEDQFKI